VIAKNRDAGRVKRGKIDEAFKGVGRDAAIEEEEVSAYYGYSAQQITEAEMRREAREQLDTNGTHQQKMKW